MKILDYLKIWKKIKQKNNKCIKSINIFYESQKITTSDVGEKKDKESNDYDIEIPKFDFRMKWNFSNSTTWAIDEQSVKESGCIHTCQGLEFDYVGVIIGNDLRFEDNKLITDFTKRASTDKSLNGIKGRYNK